MAVSNNQLEYLQQINGFVYGYSDISIKISNSDFNRAFDQIQDISWNATVEKSELGGTSPVPIGFTAGHITFKGSMTMSLEQGTELLEGLTASGTGATRVPFEITLNYGPLPGQTRLGQQRFITDLLQGVQLTNIDHSHSRGSALQMKFDFVFVYGTVQGKPLI